MRQVDLNRAYGKKVLSVAGFALDYGVAVGDLLVAVNGKDLKGWDLCLRDFMWKSGTAGDNVFVFTRSRVLSMERHSGKRLSKVFPSNPDLAGLSEAVKMLALGAEDDDDDDDGGGGDDDDDDDDDDDEEGGASSWSPVCARAGLAMLVAALALLLCGARVPAQSAPPPQPAAGGGTHGEQAAAASSTAAAIAASGAARILEVQRGVHGRGGAVEMSCRSTGNMHLPGTLAAGESCLVHCDQGCASSRWVAGHEHAVWGGGGGGGIGGGGDGGGGGSSASYLAASLVCVAAKHATGEDGGEFKLAVAAAEPRSFAASSMFGVSTSAHAHPGRAFTLQLHKTAADVAAGRRAAADRAAADEEAVSPAALRAHLRSLLAMDVPGTATAMRFFACAVGKQPPHAAAIRDFQRVAATATGGAAAAGEAALGAITESVLAGLAIAPIVASPGTATQQQRRRRQQQQQQQRRRQRVLQAEREAFAAMDLDGDSTLSVEEYVGGFIGFERALDAVMLAAGAGPSSHRHRTSGRKLRAVKQQEVVRALLGFAAHVPQERRTTAARHAEL